MKIRHWTDFFLKRVNLKKEKKKTFVWQSKVLYFRHGVVLTCQ